jgi:CheY-like chemotaxis protein
MQIKTINRPKGMNSCGTSFPEPPLTSRPRRILVADDDEAIRYLLCTVLADAGFNADAASDGQQAWEALLHEHYDLLVTDSHMPRLTGIELIERIPESGRSLPVIIVSGIFPVEQVRNHPQLQIAAVLPKPFDTSELSNTVRHVLEASWGDTTADQGTFHRLRAGLQPTR